jgi:ArsR family transcriptional regulator
MALTPEQFTKSLADLTRLRVLMLLVIHQELCVCDFTAALALPQPKVSRHLAVLRETGMLLDRRAGQWIHYRLHPDLPAWAVDALVDIARGCVGKQPFAGDRRLVDDSGGAGAALCCR